MDWLDALPWEIRAAGARQLQARVAGYLKHYRLHTEPGVRCHGRMLHRRLGGTRLLLIDCGAVARVDAGRLGSFSILQWPMRGQYVSCGGGRSLTITPAQVQVVAPDVPVNLSVSADCVLLVVRLGARSAVELGMELADAGGAQWLEGGVVLDVRQEATSSLARTLEYALLESVTGATLQGDEQARRHCEALVLASLRTSLRAARFPARSTGAGLRPQPGASACVARAERFLLRHLDRSVQLRDVALASGVAPSTLSLAFQHTHGVGPIAWWRLRRLDRCYEALNRAGDEDISVTQVGQGWGFSHLGRFSALYARRFGETPRQTLQRARARS